jgi:AcrR family transcriptional regulator
MGLMAGPRDEPAVPVPNRRRYDSRLRRERAEETRERIIAAAVDLLHGGSIRDWRRLTVRAVAARAGVNERTVYRHFVNERGLHDAVMRRLEEASGIDLDGMELKDVTDVARRIFDHVASYPLTTPPSLDPTLTDANERQRKALLRAVTRHAPAWSGADRRIAAALFDLMWSASAYERLVVDAQLDREEAARALLWVIALMAAAVDEGSPPG